MKYGRVVFAIVTTAFFLVYSPPDLWSGEAGVLVKEVILKDISLEDGENTKERKQKLWEEISSSFDFREMARRAMGPHWEERSHKEQREFTELFADNIKGAYMRKSGSRFGEKIIFLSEKQDNEKARVLVKLLKNTEKVTAGFRLVRGNGEWKISDVIFEGVSLVNNYRSQINSFLIKSTYEDLVRLLTQRQSEGMPQIVR